MAARIGAQHGDVESSASEFDFTGELATTTGGQASSYAGEMEAGLDGLMATLREHFQQMATDLQQRVADHRATLESTDWAGASKDNAVSAEAALRAETERILSQSLDQVESFRTAMHAKAESFRGAVESEFMAAMTATDTEYHQLAEASRAFARNLAAADQTIKHG